MKSFFENVSFVRESVNSGFLALFGLFLFTGCMGEKDFRFPAAQATSEGLRFEQDSNGVIFAEGFQSESGSLTFHPTLQDAGIYQLSLSYRTQGSGKGYQLTVNGVGCDGFFPASEVDFQVHPAGRVWLPAGESEMRVEGGWGNYQISELRLAFAEPYPEPKPVSAAPVNSQASPEARMLMKTLAASYGKAVFSGAMSEEDLARIETVAAVSPAWVAGDLMEDSPSRVAFGSPTGLEVDRMLAAAQKGHQITLCWHWNAPTGLINKASHINDAGEEVAAHWWSGFYTRATTFNVATALADQEGEDYQLLLHDMDAIAVQLKRLEDAGVPVLWRPLHESDGGWFWWGAQGPDAFKALWRLLYQRLVIHHNLNNLLWVYTWSDSEWYPGDDVVDMIGLDLYPSRANDLMGESWGRALKTFDGRKLIGLGEVGSAPNLEDQWGLGIRWAFFVPWNGKITDPAISDAEIRAAYRHPAVLNRKEVFRIF